jgi:endoglucanase
MRRPSFAVRRSARRACAVRRAGLRSRRGRRVASLLLLAILVPACAAAQQCQPPGWPEWDDFVKNFVQQDGRVLDASTPQQHSFSEGQSYGMFFALVAGDSETFERLWRWSVDNLAAGDVAHHLPAWVWGRRDDGTWGVIDSNAASDADLWFAYDLLEAARAWNRSDYAADAHALLDQIEASEVVDLPGFGMMLLPGPDGFAKEGGLWRVNPSYLPVPVLRRLAGERPKAHWTQIATNTLRLIRKVSPNGYAPDWVGYQADGGGGGQFVTDPIKGAAGSYDAIRTYLWAGMTSPADPLARPLQAALKGLADATASAGAPPETVQTDSGASSGTSPFGFSAALLPYLQATGRVELLQSQRERVRAGWAASLTPEQLAQRQPPYYDFVLSLFGTGWLDSRYQFLRSGQVGLLWEKSCR